MPAQLEDASLDKRWAARARALTTGVCHGDYYRRNVLVADRRVTGVIDWHEAYVGHLIGEVAWAAWEFGHGDDLALVRGRFDLFVDEYERAARGLIPSWEYELIPLATRLMLRDNIALALSLGAASTDDYQQRRMAAFWTLADELG